MYNIKVSKEVDKFLSKHPDIAARFFKVADILAIDPFSEFLPAKKLV